jgi:predicted amidophosphoribosyltransferase
MIPVIIELIFPKTHLQIFLETCSYIEFESKLTPRPQKHDPMFYPFYYKDPFVKDCIIELKERNNMFVAHRFGIILSKWVLRKIDEIEANYHPGLGKCHPELVSGSFPKNHETPKQVRGDNQVTQVRGDTLFKFYLIPVPQHKMRTREKGFCHTTTLARAIQKELVLRGRNTVFFNPCIVKEKHIKKLHAGFNKKRRNTIIKNSMRAYITKQDAQRAYFFIIDDVYTTGATFKEVRRSLKDCAVPDKKIFYISIAH